MPDPIVSTTYNRLRRSLSETAPPAVAGPRRLRWLWALLPVAGFTLFGGVVWLAYKDTSHGPAVGEPPLIKAAADPIKLPPEGEESEESVVAEGGVVGRLWGDAERADQPERLLPLPEEPLSPRVAAEDGESTEPPLEAPTTPDLPSSSGAPTGDREAGEVAAEAVPADAPVPQPDPSDAMAEAEAALDRLLAEVTALSEEPPTSPEATAPAPAAAATGEPPAERPPAAETTTTAAPTLGRPSPGEPESSLALESEETASDATPAVESEEPPTAEAPSTPETESTEIRRASALTPPPSAAEPVAGETVATPADAETGEITPAPAETTQVAAIEDRFRIQLAAVREEADARRAWDLFRDDLGPVLGAVQPFFERAETANGVFYRLQIGRFATQQAAESLCEELKQRNASCFVIPR